MNFTRALLSSVAIGIAACNAIIGNDAPYQLVPLGAKCTLNSDCSGTDVCLFERCSAACAADKDCSPGYRCLTTSADDGAACVAAEVARCSGDECPSGTRCASDGCRTICGEASPCRADQECRAETCFGTDPKYDLGAFPLDPNGGSPGSGGANGDGSAGRDGAGGVASGGASSMGDSGSGGGSGTATGGTSNGGTPSESGGAGGAHSGGSGGAPACGFTVCGTGTAARCIDTDSDASHCGVCDHDCLEGECEAGKCKPRVLVSGQSSPKRIIVTKNGIYWTNYVSSGSVVKAGLDGKNVSPIATAQPFPWGIAADLTHVYWSNHRGAFTPALPGGIMKAPLSGGSAIELVREAREPQELFVRSGQLYYVAYDARGIHSVSINGGAVTQVADDGHPYDLAVNASGGNIYYINYGMNRVSTSPTWAKEISHLFQMTTTQAVLRCIAEYNDLVYFSSSDGTIRSVSKTSKEMKIVASSQAAAGELEADASGVYWTAGDNIVRLNGTMVETLASNQAAPQAIALTAAAVYWANGRGEIVRLAK